MAGPTNTQFAVAIHVLTLLGNSAGTPVSSEVMSESAAVSPVYLRRVLGRLREAGLVGSRPGPRGGWVLQREPSAITLGDAWRAVQEGAPLFGLHGVQPGCPVGASITETLAGIDRQLTASVEAELDGITVERVMPDLSAFSAEERMLPGTAPQVVS